MGRGPEGARSPAAASQSVRGAGKVDQQRDRSPFGTEDRPIGGAGALQAGVDDIFRVMGLVGLRNQAVPAVELGGEGSRKLGKGTDRQMADEIRDRAACDYNLAGDVQRRGAVGPEAMGWRRATRPESIR